MLSWRNGAVARRKFALRAREARYRSVAHWFEHASASELALLRTRDGQQSWLHTRVALRRAVRAWGARAAAPAEAL
eukprot:2051908-Prymnesium_polylepis.1